MRKFRDRLKEDLKKPEFRKAYRDEAVFVDLAVEIAKLRQENKMTQAELARRLRTSQQTVSRLEDPHNASFSLKTLIRIARACNKTLSVKFL